MADVGSDKVVVLDLAVQRCNTATLCDAEEVNGDTDLKTNINADIEGLGGLVSASSAGDLSVGYNAEARIKLGFTLSLSAPQVYVMPGTGIDLAGEFNAEDLIHRRPRTVHGGGRHSRRRSGRRPRRPGRRRRWAGHCASRRPIVRRWHDHQTGRDRHLPRVVSARTWPRRSQRSTTRVVERSSPIHPNPGDTATLSGLGCTAISLGISAGGVTNYAGDLGLTVADDFTITPHIPANLAAQLAAAALDLRLIMAALPEIIGSVEGVAPRLGRGGGREQQDPADRRCARRRSGRGRCAA